MTLFFIGLGLFDEKDISLKGLETIQRCEFVYLDAYTGVLGTSVEKLSALYNKEIIISNRTLVEKQAEDRILADASKKDVAFLVVGDPMSATTHIDLMMRAKELGIRCKVIHGASVFTAVGITGLQIYKFGKVTSIPFESEGFRPRTCYDVLTENQTMGLHTLMLLDLKPEESRFMSVNQAIEYMLSLEKDAGKNIFSEDTLCVGCARLGSNEPSVHAGTARELININFGAPMHCLIVPGRLHFMEEEALKIWKA